MKPRSRMRGITLVELMVAMTLGLVVIGGAISLTLANRQSYRTNEGLSQMQESARTAFELIARDIRQAGVTGCDNNTARIANTLNDQTVWWRSWFGVAGFAGDEDSAASNTGVNEREEGTDSIQLQGIQGLALAVADHAPATFTMSINTAGIPAGAIGLQTGDVLIACDFDHSTIFQVSNYDPTAQSIQHNQGTVPAPGNCSRGLDFPTDCSSLVGNTYDFERNAQLGRFFATEWYIGKTGLEVDGGLSLFRLRVGPGGVLLTEEIVSGVVDMQITYRLANGTAFLEADALSTAQWQNVNAARLVLTVESTDTRVSSDLTDNEGRLDRTFTQIIALRNRVP